MPPNGPARTPGAARTTAWERRSESLASVSFQFRHQVLFTTDFSCLNDWLLNGTVWALFLPTSQLQSKEVGRTGDFLWFCLHSAFDNFRFESPQARQASRVPRRSGHSLVRNWPLPTSSGHLPGPGATPGQPLQPGLSDAHIAASPVTSSVTCSDFLNLSKPQRSHLSDEGSNSAFYGEF